MYRILVADDEKIVLNSVSLIIEKYFNDVSYQTARSGRQAIETADNFRPDIILMDIRMPGINGIDAINQIRSRLKNTLIIIISAYEQFEYAKEALKMGVIDYLLKPISKNNLINSIQNAIKIVDSERQNREKEIENIERYENILPYIEHNVIYSIVLGDQFIEMTKKYSEILSIKSEGGYIIVLEVYGKSNFEVLDQDFYSFIRDTIKYKCRCIIGPLMLNRIVILVLTNYKEEYTQRLEAIEIGEYTSGKINAIKPEIELTIGIGSYTPFSNMLNSYDEALKALNFGRKNDINHIKDITGNIYTSFEYPRDQEKIFINACVLGEKDDALRAFGEIYKWLYKNYIDSFNEVKSKLFEIVVIIHRDRFNDSLADIFQLNDFTSLETWCRERITALCSEISKAQKKNINKIILSAKSYIDKNYNKEITLDEISREACVSPHYFSRLFKEETGENYIDYLTNKRIDKAKEIMEDSDLSIKEICFHIGYNDPNYFSRLFKRIEKVTPTEYLKIMKREDER